jgi:hypothetical protein
MYINSKFGEIHFMKILTFLILVGTFCFSQSIYTQVAIDGLTGRYWGISAMQFEDGSYVISCNDGSNLSKIVMLDKSGKQTLAKTTNKKEQWTFGNRPISNFASGWLNIPIVDTKNKICYNLNSRKGMLTVTIVNEKLESETIVSDAKPYKKFQGLYNYTAPVCAFDSEGNPIWAITQNKMGILWVKYNIKEKRLEQKFFEHEGYSNNVRSGYDGINASVIGFKNDKVWFARVTARGIGENTCKITIYSIDNKQNLKSEKEFKLKKPVDNIGIDVKSVNQQTNINTDKMLFTFHTQAKDVAWSIRELWFISFDGSVVQSAKWENNTGTFLMHKELIGSISNNNQARFIIGDDYGSAIIWDVDYNVSEVTNVSTLDKILDDNKLKTPTDQSDRMIFSSFLYENVLSDKMKTNIGESLKSGNIPLIFPVKGDNFLLIDGLYKEQSTAYITRF